ncbi:hypothetical protein GJV85_03215 [Sulfurimonas aquatica]|uniref:Sulfur reduction protein DsrE n=1 Tax=Sulfurimonas aquatica TaxID=2672570 RepID=A0A975AYX9_9BACT|nr:DsrE family protein [Sulfurimonas aquatica]QSZ41161.1 hypothetical protein GJV85_03215 [Sulfurimonas aquatica]
MKLTKLIYALAVVMMMVVPSSANDNDEDDVVNIVYQCDFADPKRIHLMLNTMNNVVKHYNKNMIQYDLNLVALGPCLQYVMKDFKGTGFVKKPYQDHGGPSGNGTAGRISSLKQTAGDSLTIYACGNTMEKKNVKPEQILDFVELTPAGIIKAIDLQRDGYAYIKIK